MMTKYYVIHVKDESAGEYPDSYDWDNPYAPSKLRKYIRDHKEFPSFTPNLELEIYDDSEFNKINDFIFGPIKTFCISEKVKRILNTFNLPKHRYYPVKVLEPRKYLGIFKTKKEIKNPYYAFCYDSFHISNLDNCIDFDRTSITKDSMGIDKSDEVFFKNNFDHSLDLFEIRLSWMTYVSERLKESLIKEEVTGIEFSEINERKYMVDRPNPKLIW
ncbi:hypothetical protein [Croceitalea rosinachiae]|uniref:Immunity protein 43 domain-containing protein n=1 Tax=Croceitalea rosinachiae TaxID=3075596 RepID=A0ABU3ADT0_9FLAO|nr:hypothetical protein [Croceitalea sp. F388]MDT0608055.1 hypothetical protein [Croceitalea sp. F388]